MMEMEERENKEESKCGRLEGEMKVKGFKKGSSEG